MIRGLEDGLDQVSALRFAACNTSVRSGATNRQKRAKRAGVGIDADCLGTRPDRGRMAASPGMLCYPRIRPWERSLRGGWPGEYLSTYLFPLLSLESPLLTRFLTYLETVME